MARPTKQGIEYFSLDVDFAMGNDFFSDIKVRRISKACGPASTSILICLLCNIYRDKGYYIEWDEDLPFVVADTIGTTEGAVEEVVKKAVQVGFFDKSLFDQYRILTSNRLPNGNIFAAEYYFEVQIGEMKRVELAFRNANLEDMLENISIPEFTLRKEDGSTVKASELTADGKHILAFLEEEKEPTEHILNEMMEQEEAFSRYAKRIIFVVKSKKALETPTLSRALGKLGNVQILYDDFSEIINTLGRRMYVDPDKLPLIIVTNGSLNGIYATSGYNVGTGDMLLRLL